MWAIIIKKQHANEFDLLVTCYTRERGKLMAVAKGALKHSSAQAMHLDPLNIIEFKLIERRSCPLIASAQSECVFTGIKSSPLLAAMAGFFAEIVDRIVKDNEWDAELWNVLESALSELDQTRRHSEAFEVFRRKQYELLDVLGYAPQATKCMVCSAGAPQEGWIMSPEHGSIVCMQCAADWHCGILMSKQDIALLHGRFYGHNQSRSALDALFEHLGGAPMSSLGLIYRLAAEHRPVL